MNILLIKPLEHPASIELDELTLEYMQSIVGGPIEAVYPFDDPVALICNEDGKTLRLPPNRELVDSVGTMYDIIHGNILVVGIGEEDFEGLSDELLKKYREYFWVARMFIKNYEDEITVVPCADAEEPYPPTPEEEASYAIDN